MSLPPPPPPSRPPPPPYPSAMSTSPPRPYGFLAGFGFGLVAAVLGLPTYLMLILAGVSLPGNPVESGWAVIGGLLFLVMIAPSFVMAATLTCLITGLVVWAGRMTSGVLAVAIGIVLMVLLMHASVGRIWTDDASPVQAAPFERPS